jgi:PAS domain S-box-containing protein
VSEEKRLEALRSYEILDTEPEREFNLVVQNVAKIFSAPMVRMTLVDEFRTWFKAKVGVSATEAPRETSICNFAIEEDSYLYIKDVRLDDRFKNNKTVVGPPYIRTYVGAVIKTPDGHKIGSLCVIYTDVVEVTGDQIDILIHFSELITELLEARKRKIQADVLDSVLNVGTTGHAIVLRDGTFKFASEQFQNITQYSEDDLRKMTVEDLIPKGVEPHHSQYLTKEYKEKAKNIFGKPREMEIINKQQKLLPVELSVSPIHYGDETAFVASLKDITRRKEREFEQYRLKNFQKLTQIPNRRLLSTHLYGAIKEDRKFFVVNLQFHGLEKINRKYGIQVGSDYILYIATLLKQLEKENCFLFHISRLDFVFILQSENNYDVEILMSKISKLSSQPVPDMDYIIPVSFNAGVTIYPTDGQDVDTLIHKAYAAMTRSVSKGAMSYAYHVNELANQTELEDKIEYHLEGALARGELELFYQPKVDSESHVFLGAEALIRWNNETLGFVSPADFIPVAENSGLILPIGSWIIDQGCKQVRKLLDLGYDDFVIALNISPRQVIQDIIMEKLETAMNRYEIDGKYIELEVTEGLFLDGSSTVSVQLDAIKVLDASLALDDFGTGYSSISYLRDYPFDTLKIDQSFIRELDVENESQTSLLHAIVAMGRALNMKIVGEGVEKVEQANFLRDIGCQILQGYHFAKPMAEDAFLDWLSSQQAK